MGQIGIPMMNKVGYSMFWNSMWDDKFNYSRSLREDIFLKYLLVDVFDAEKEVRIMVTEFSRFGYEDIFDYLEKVYGYVAPRDLELLKKHNLEELNMQEMGYGAAYLSKFWILRYQTWVVIYVFVYHAHNTILTVNKIAKKDKLIKLKLFKKSRLKYINLVSQYYFNLLKLDFNFDLYKQNIFNKYCF